jgi:hypothetical protein
MAMYRTCSVPLGFAALSTPGGVPAVVFVVDGAATRVSSDHVTLVAWLLLSFQMARGCCAKEAKREEHTFVCMLAASQGAHCHGH